MPFLAPCIPNDDRYAPWPRRARQTGSVAISVAIAFGTLIVLLIGIELGYLFYQKRELQKAVDLAALAGAAFVAPLDCGEGVTHAKASANGTGPGDPQRNLPPAFMLEDADITCGRWDPTAYADAPHFGPGVTDYNAIRIAMQREAPPLLPFFPGTRVIAAEAVAMREEPLAVFSVGSTLVHVGCHQKLAPLVQLLKIVGTGDPCVTVGGYEGLVGAHISASGLLAALGLPLTADLTIADIHALLAARTVKLGLLLETALKLAGQEALLDVNARLLSLLDAQLGIDALDLEIPLGTGPDGPGIFAAIHAPEDTKATALDVQLDVLDLITAAVGVGTSGRGVSVPGLGVQIPGILPNLLEVKAGVIEPPSIGIGGEGATAYNAQVRLYIDVDTAGGAVGGLLQLLGTRVKLPIFVDLVRAKATVEHLSCESPLSDSTAQLRVDSSVAQACIGKVSGDPFSIRTPICESLENETLVSVLGLLKLDNRVKVDAFHQSEISPPLRAGETWQTAGNGLDLGTTLAEVVNELLRLLSEALLGSPTGGDWTPAENEEAAIQMARYYLGLSSPAHPGGPMPTVPLGASGPTGAYDVDALATRLSADMNRMSQSCLLLGLICWKNDEWADWARHVRTVACIGAVPEEGFVTIGPAGTPLHVDRYNRCVERELKEELMKPPPSSGTQSSLLQTLLGPLLDLLEAILNPIGNLLAGPVLSDLLGIDLGVNDVNVRSVGCGHARLVY